MKDILDVAIAAAKAAGASIQEAANDLSVLNIEQKSPNDFVSEVDRNAEQIVVNYIKNAFPDHCVLGEEYGTQGGGDSRYTWVVDPLDGTTNFLRSLPHYAVSIAVLKGQEIECAVVFDPAKNELFTALRGGGAYLNSTKISVSASTSVRGTLLSTGVPFSGKNLEKIDSFTKTMTLLLEQQTSGIRRFGAAALDLAYVAAGRYDGFWEANLQKWDIAAGVLLVTEAGGVVSDFNGEQQFLDSGDVIAAPAGVHSGMQLIAQRCYSE